MIEIHSYLPISSVEGPGLRFVIWVQGCSIRCRNCANKHMWDTGKGKKISIDTLFKKVKDQKDIEGVTFLGGEPFDQAGELAELALKVQEINLGIITFTGYTYEQIIESSCHDSLKLLEYTDLLIDGPFDYGLQTDNFPWAGSSNQRYIHLSNRYLGFRFTEVNNGLELRFDEENSEIIVNGLENMEVLDKLIQRIRDKGLI